MSSPGPEHVPDRPDSAPRPTDSAASPNEPSEPRPLPPLPRSALDPVPVVVVGSLLWFVGSCVFFVTDVLLGPGPGLWFWTCTVGWVLGIVGYLVFRWQQAAARRGSRTAQRGL